jgi:hypothetical protein
VKEKLGQAAVAMNSEYTSRLSIYRADRNFKEAAEFVGGHAQRGGQAAVGTSPSCHRDTRKSPLPLVLALSVGVRCGARFVEDATPPVVKEKFGDAAGTYLH